MGGRDRTKGQKGGTEGRDRRKGQEGGSGWRVRNRETGGRRMQSCYSYIYTYVRTQVGMEWARGGWENNRMYTIAEWASCEGMT